MIKKTIKNPHWNVGVYGCVTTVGDLKKMLEQFPDDLRVQIDDPRNPYGWIDVKSAELCPATEWTSKYVHLKTSCHEK